MCEACDIREAIINLIIHSDLNNVELKLHGLSQGLATSIHYLSAYHKNNEVLTLKEATDSLLATFIPHLTKNLSVIVDNTIADKEMEQNYNELRDELKVSTH